MQRRLVLFDQNEINPALLYGRGLGNDLLPLSAFSGLSDEQIRESLRLALGDGDGVMLVGGNAFKWLREYIHFGVRGENYVDCSKLYRLSLEGGIFAKCCPEAPGDKEIEEFMSGEFTKKVEFPWFKHKVIHTIEEAWKFLDWLESLPEDEDLAADFEASGMPHDKWFEISGLSICNKYFGGFISFTDLRHNTTEDNYNALLQRIGKLVVKRMRHIWVYNMGYEYQVFHRMFGIDAYDLCDASVFNYLRGDHLKPYSLKWTAQKVLCVSVWDTEFDRISDLIDSMFFVEVGKLKAEKHKELKINPMNYKSTPEWLEICDRYPDYVPEFEQLISEYWDKSAFMVIPSSILGYYCNLDSMHTLYIVEAEKDKYTETAIETFLDNIRITCQLHSCGINKDEEFRVAYEDYCKTQMAWGITYCATARCYIKMDKHRQKMANLKRYNPIAQKLLYNNTFFNGDTVEIAKYLLSNNIDTIDVNDIGLNTGSLMLTYGEDFAVSLENILRESMFEVGMIKTDRKGNTVIKEKIGEKDISRKKKLLELVGEKIKPLLGLDKIKLGEKHLELEKYLFYERAYNELTKVSQNQLNDINNIPDHIYAFGQNRDLLDYSTYISKNLFFCTSPEENDELCYEFAQLYPTESAYLAAILESVQQLDGGDKFYKNRGITTIDDGYMDFMMNWEKVCNGTPVDQTPYPIKMYELATQFYNDLKCDQVKEVWSNFNGYVAQEQFFSEVTDQYLEYCKSFDPSDLNNRLFFMRKLVLCYLMYKKYAKTLSTYISGLFVQEKTVIEDPRDHVILREADPGEPGAIQKLTTYFQCMQKSSKRFSSPYHTIISHSDIKSVIHSYPGCLLSYFDISSAEIRTAAAQSKDPTLQGKFDSGEDVYIACGKIYMGEDGWNALSDKDKKKWRKAMKSTMLGILYGLGKNSLAERINTSPTEAERIIETVFKTYPLLKPYIESQQKYPFLHDGKVNTLFGDILIPPEWKYYQEATTQKDKKNLEARLKRLAVNLPIQGGTSLAIKEDCGIVG